MAYEVTATRRRPQTFEDLVGQEFVVATLKNAIETGKIAHAYLFSGPRGCGKTSSARILAKALNCEKGPNATPCGVCNTCREIARGSNLDVIEIDGASNTSVNDVRQIKDEVLFPPNSSRYKIYIIDEVHMLSTSAFNALLKTIEEPPPYVIFIFATTELHKVPATIKSRCQQFNFRLVSPEIVKGLLADAAKEMQIQADDEALYWIARESTGSVRDAYTLFDQVAAFSGDHITFEKIRDKLGLTGVDKLNELCELFIDGNTGTALEKLDEVLQSGVSIEQFVINFSDYLRSLILIQNGVKKESLIGQSAARFSQKVLAAWDSIKLERALSMFLQLYRDIRYSLSPRFELELALSRLAFLAGYVSPVEVKAAIDSARNLLLAGSKMNPPQTQGFNQGGSAPLSQSGFSGHNTETAFNSSSINPFEQIRRNIAESRPLESRPQPNQPAPQIGIGQPPVFSAAHSAPPAQPAAPKPPVTQNSFQINMQAASAVFDSAGEVPPKPLQPPKPEPMQTTPQFVQQTQAMQNFGTAASEAFQPETEEDYSGYDDSDDSYEESPQIDSALQSFDPSANRPAAPAQPEQDASSTDSLLDEAINRISSEKTLIGTALLNAVKWSFNSDKITCFIDKPFLKNQIESEKKYISSVFSELKGSPVLFDVEFKMHEDVEQQQNENIPNEVNLLCQVFKGKQIPQ